MTAATALGMAGAGGLYLGLVTGALTVDLGIGRRTRPLGPIEVTIAASRRLVYDAATAPYAARTTRVMAEKVTVLERGDGMVLAAHRTPVGGRLVATTVETVAFDPPERIGFRFFADPSRMSPSPSTSPSSTKTPPGSTKASSAPTCGPSGSTPGDLVAGAWEATVQASLDSIKAEAERRRR